MKNSKTPLAQAISIAGSQKALAELISSAERKFSQQNIWWWAHKSNGKVPAHVAPLIEKKTGVKKSLLRPDVFGEAA